MAHHLDFYNDVLNKFSEINNFSLGVVNKWREGRRLVHNKTNCLGDINPVTDIDYKIEDFAIGLLKRFASNIPIFGEETCNNVNFIINERSYFVIDPIDGTNQLVNGSNEWSVSICLVENGEPTVASIYMPDDNLWFTAIKGQGSLINGGHIFLEKKPIYEIGVSPRQIKDVSVGKFVKSCGFKEIEIGSLTPKIGAILQGGIDAAVYFPGEKKIAVIWDYAAAVLLIKESGGIMTSLDGKELSFFGSGVIHKDGWLAAKSVDIYNKLLFCFNKRIE